MIEAIAQLHATLGIVLLALLVLLAAAVAVGVLTDRRPDADGRLRRVALGVVVAQVALGLTLALRGRAPAEGIHWLYGGAIVLALLAPSAIDPATRRGRDALLVGGTILAAVFAWRLWGSG